MKWPIRAVILCLAIGCAAVGEENRRTCKDLSYESRNQTDYGPLQVSKIRGTMQDAQGSPIPKACVAIFTEIDHKLIALTETDRSGYFKLKGIPDGNYRLIAKYEGFCPANAKVRIERNRRIKKPLSVKMRFAGIDTCSYIELR
jgi:hypothetical protein